MKKLAFLMIGSLVWMACSKEAPQPALPEPVYYDMRFQIGRIIDYTAPQYQDFQAEVKLYLFYVNSQTLEQTPVWDTTLASRPVLNFPAFAQPMQVLRRITNARIDQQELHVSYNIAFFRNNVIQYQSGFSEMVRPVNATKEIEVKL